MKVEVIARRGFGITKKGGRARLPKDHAAALVKMGIAEYAPVEVVKPAPPLVPKGNYKRRDMVAEKAEYPRLGAAALSVKDDGKA